MKSLEFWDHHVIGPVQTNCYVISKRSGEAILFDPGGPEAVEIVNKLKERGVEVKHVLVTHGHFDHLGWATEVQKAVEGARVYLHEGERESYEIFQSWLPRLGYSGVELREPDVWITDDQRLEVSGLQFRVMHTPGHSPGSVTYVHEGGAYVGDLIFRQSIGRVDLPFSDPADMERSLKRIIQELDPSTQLFPGHGELTRMEEELRSNPFLLALQSGQRVF